MVKESYQREEILALLSEIKDPEIPVVTIEEMGMLRDVILSDKGCEILLTPTYTACSAMEIIEQDILSTLKEARIENAKVTMVFAPAWTTDWMSETTKEKLIQFGIAAPVHSSCSNWLSPKNVEVKCPKCESTDTKLISQFGSTACKALYSCNHCQEPFDYFKCH
ncbi:MAG: 1,2-phenylacetyl-CoA epoxidase subunit PaaD [Chitinophagaceae bacterium]|jgi:ring-1,2-phenylacetyl-CoA epoxidase subunit PaaD